MHRLVLRREPVREGGHKCERGLRRALVLREVKCDAPEQMQRGIDLTEPFFQPARSLRQRGDSRLHLPPQRFKNCGARILRTAHCRDAQGQCKEQPVRCRDSDRRTLVGLRHLREDMEKRVCKLPPKNRPRRPASHRSTHCRKGEQSVGRRARKVRLKREHSLAIALSLFDPDSPYRAQCQLVCHTHSPAQFPLEKSTIVSVGRTPSVRSA